MNLLLFTDNDLVNAGCIEVSGRRLQHLLDVHKAKVGDQVRIGQLGGRMGSGEILELNTSNARLSVTLTETPPQKLPIHLVLALPRPKMLRRILRTVAEFGVPELHLINSYRVEKSYWQTPVLETKTIREYLIQGLEQAKDTILPTVTCHQRFKPFVEDIFPALLGTKEGLLAHPGEYPPAPTGPCAETVLVIGPEGGFIPYEVEKFQGAGCKTLSLGPRILRVENAVNSLLGRLS
ncbi:MAG: 16S rRNA (uracil(1498)-N(3))-methyltransferase [Halioglobus sp.]